MFVRIQITEYRELYSSHLGNYNAISHKKRKYVKNENKHHNINTSTTTINSCQICHKYVTYHSMQRYNLILMPMITACKKSR